MKRSLVVILSAVVISLAACGGEAGPAAQPSAQTPATTAGPIPARPIIRMSALGEEHDGLLGAYCWLQAANDIRCEPDPLDLQPDTTVAVERGDVLTFTIQSDSGLPGSFYATLLDDRDADGDPVVVDFGATASADYTIALDPGVHRFSVVAEYPDVGGDNSFVTTIFAIEVPTAVAAVPTPRPTATTPPTAAPGVTVTATEVLAPSPKAPTEVPTTIPTPVLPTEAPTEVPTEVPTQMPATEPPPTAALPTPITVPPSAVPTSAPAPGVDFAQNPPAMVVVNGGRRFLPSGTQYCYRDASGREVCVDAPASPESERILVASGDTIRLDAEGTGPFSMTITLSSSDRSQEFQRVELPGSNISLYTIVGNPGNYVLVIDTVWPEGTATYYFRLQIVG